MRLLSVLLLCIFASTGNARQTMVVRMDYGFRHNGMFHIPIKNNATVTNIMWCSELLPPQPGQVQMDIQDCHARGILKAQVYPGDTRHYEFKNNGRTIQISPEAIGGFWMNRQADIVIHGTVNDGKNDFEQIVRINPLVPGNDETKMVDDHVPVKKPYVAPPPPIDNDNDKEKGNVGIGQAHIPPPVHDDDEETTSHPPAEPKFILFVTLGFGVAIMVVTVFLAVTRRHRNRQTKFTRPYHESSTFEFNKSSMLHSELRLAMGDDEDSFIMIDEQNDEKDYDEYLEDQAILNQIGSGR